MVSLKRTNKYRGKMAKNYTTKREKQYRWIIENNAVSAMLDAPEGSWILDAPVGRGRFLQLYGSKGYNVCGIDISDEMLVYANQLKIPNVLLYHGDVTKIEVTQRFHTSVCVRFLDLIPEDAMNKVLKELDRVTDHCLILTIRLGSAYIPKTNTATHDEKKFLRLIRKLHWQIAEDVPVFSQGWHVYKLRRTAQ